MKQRQLARASFISIVLLCSALHAAERPPEGFRRGVNLSSWFANALRQPLDERDFQQIQRVGFDHVRLPVDPEYLGFRFLKGHPNRALGGGFVRIDRVIDLANRVGLPVVLDIHPQAEFMKTLEENPWAETQFVDLWTELSLRYKGFSDNMLAFEPLNEPQYYNRAERYRRLVVRLVSAIRKDNPSRWIIVGAPQGSAIEGLYDLSPAGDGRIIYAFHYYLPYLITHQGFHMGFEGMMLRHFRQTPYPSSLADRDAKVYAPGATDMAVAEKELAAYKAENWGADRIASDIGKAKEWAEVRKVPLICGEFGVFRNHNDLKSRYRWIADVRKALDANGVGWEIWDYTDLFGIAELAGDVTRPDLDGSVRLVNPLEGTRIVEPEAIEALGLTPHKR